MGREREPSLRTQAAVFHRPYEPLTIESVDIAAPWAREVLVRTVASGVCHSDLHPIDRPSEGRRELTAMGHEGAGIVEIVGEDVTTVRVGDHVVACVKGFCGVCQQCLTGRPNLCAGSGVVARPEAANQRITLGGIPVRQVGGVSSHAGYMLVHENSIVKIEPDIPLDRAALLSCGVLTGLGAVLRTAALRAGESVAVFGCGGVGLSAIQGARIGGARVIIAVDLLEGKLELARSFGATHVVNGEIGDPVLAIRELTSGAGVDHAFEAVGSSELVRQAVASLAIGGTATIMGILPSAASIEFPWIAVQPECRVQTSRLGSARFRVDIPRYLELYKRGALMLDQMISRRVPLDGIETAFEAMRRGEVARSVLLFD